MPQYRDRRDVLDSGEDVTGWDVRDLVIRCINGQLAVSHQLGQLAAEVSGLKKKQTRDEGDLTIVRNLRAQLKSTRRTALGIIAGVLVIVIAAYVCKRLGLVPLG